MQAFVKTDNSTAVVRLDHRVKPLLDHAFGPGVKASIGGSMTTPVALSDMVIRGKLLNMAMIGAVVFALSMMLFRSVMAGFLMLVPLALVALVNFGLMGWLGIPLQVATATVAALATVTTRSTSPTDCAEELVVDDIELAVRRTYATAGKASLYVACAVGGGYAVLTLSHGFNVHLWLGSMVALAMFVSAVVLILYPALLLSLRPAFVFRVATTDSPALELPAALT